MSDGWDGCAGKGHSSPSSGQVPQPQLTLRLEASGSPKRGAHHVQSWGGPGQSGPLCASPAVGRRAGGPLRPDAMEKETTAPAAGPLPSYSSKEGGWQGVIKGGLGLPRDGGAPGCSTRPTGNLRFQAGEGVRGARAWPRWAQAFRGDWTPREGAGRQGNKLVVSFTDGLTEAERRQGLWIPIQSLNKRS